MTGDTTFNPEAVPRLELYHLPGFHEPVSAITHLIGAVTFIVLGAMLLRRGRGSTSRLIFLGVYAASCVFLLSMSAVYHMLVRGGTANRVLERLDHGAIFVLIAGTFTPAHGILFRGIMRWGPLLLIWSAAITGITLKTIFFDNLAEWVGLSFYLGLGWVGSMSAFWLVQRYGFAFVAPLVWGGIAYTLGAVAEYLGWMTVIPGVVHAHEVFHFLVLAGAFWHWLFVWQFATGEVVLKTPRRSIAHRPPPEPAAG
jgi:channel protein (hemolysin III family)